MQENSYGKKLLNRRNLLIAGGVSLGTASLAALKPADRSGPRHAYFLEMQSALKAAGISTPRLVIDRSRLNANIDTLNGHLPAGLGYRIVAKSLPSLPLLAHIQERTGTNRLMTFNLPMLLALSKESPGADQLLGKPLPVEAARQYLEAHEGGEETATKVQWLIDTPQRLAQYEQLAGATGQSLRVNIELDVGLHRGGVQPGADLQAMLQKISESPSLQFSGFMGYEPHIPSLPTVFGWRDSVLNAAWSVYREALAQAAALFGEETVRTATRNAAGSPTYRYYQDMEIANEVSAGSTLLKPTDFDKPLLEDHQPAVFIATPALKVSPMTRLPGLESLTGVRRLWNPNYDKTVFIYGGHWLAKPEDPPGLSYNPIFGRSSNQEMLNGGTRLDIQPDDFVFLRPTQSEAVLLQFGDLLIYEDGKIVDEWSVFPATA